jgi:hypothetical protein
MRRFPLEQPSQVARWVGIHQQVLCEQVEVKEVVIPQFLSCFAVRKPQVGSMLAWATYNKHDHGIDPVQTKPLPCLYNWQ